MIAVPVRRTTKGSSEVRGRVIHAGSSSRARRRFARRQSGVGLFAIEGAQGAMFTYLSLSWRLPITACYGPTPARWQRRASCVASGSSLRWPRFGRTGLLSQVWDFRVVIYRRGRRGSDRGRRWCVSRRCSVAAVPRKRCRPGVRNHAVFSRGGWVDNDGSEVGVRSVCRCGVSVGHAPWGDLLRPEVEERREVRAQAVRTSHPRRGALRASSRLKERVSPLHGQRYEEVCRTGDS